MRRVIERTVDGKTQYICPECAATLGTAEEGTTPDLPERCFHCGAEIVLSELNNEFGKTGG